VRKHKKVSIKRRIAVTTTLAVAASSIGTAAFAAIGVQQVATRATSTWTPPSSDPSGIAFIPGKGLLVSDAEVEETAFTDVGGVKFAHNNNLFLSNLSGNRTGGGSTTVWSKEPTGVAYVSAAGNKRNGWLYVSDDDRKEVFEIQGAGADGQFGTADDGARKSFKTSPFGNTDPEDVAYDPVRNELWIAGGLSTIFSRVNPGADDDFATTGDNVTRNYSIPQKDPLKPPSPEGMAWDPARQTVYVLDGESNFVFEYAHNGSLLNEIDLNNINMQSPGGITLDPASTGTSRTFYIADRGLDPNGTRVANCPVGAPPTCEAFNDGTVHEVVVSGLPAIGNIAPVADAGEDQISDTNETLTLKGFGEDGELPSAPQPLTFRWTQVQPDGSVTFGTPNAATTTVTFSSTGVKTLRLTVSDGQQSDIDDVVVNVYAPGAERTVTIPIRVGGDDAQEQVGTSSPGFTDLTSPDNELGNTNGDAAATAVLTGLRFADLPIVKGSTVTNASIQFSTDEINQPGHNLPASYVIKGERVGNAAPFVGTKFNLTTRTPTTTTVAWNNVPVWDLVREEGADQRTPNLAPILQEIISLPEWSRGNAAVFTIGNASGNAGRRTAESKDGRFAPELTARYTTPANVAPVVRAGSNLSVNMPGLATLNGSVTWDSKANGARTTTWSKASGPGTVSFGNAAALSTTASFSAPGNYTLRLTANDGPLSSFGEMNVNVMAASPAGKKNVTLTATTSATILRTGGTATITGVVEPAENGQVIKLQQRRGTSWVDTATATVTDGAVSAARFTVSSSRSALVQYRLVSPATATSNEAVSNTLTLLFYATNLQRVNYKKDVVKVKNTGAVEVNFEGWVLKNKKNGKSVRLPEFVLKPGAVVRLHSGVGKSSARHLYLDTKNMWGKRGKAVLKDGIGTAADSLRY
jgi:hypothetical protein